MGQYRFTSFWAALLVLAGILLIAAGLAVGALLVLGGPLPGLPPQTFGAGRPAAAVSVVLVTLLAGGSSIVIGQLLQMFVEQRRVLRALHRRLRAIDLRDRERDAVERAVPRKPRRPDTLKDLRS